MLPDVRRDILPWQLAGATAPVAVDRRLPGDECHTATQQADIPSGPLRLPDPLGARLRKNADSAAESGLSLVEVASLFDLFVGETLLAHIEQVLITRLAGIRGLRDCGRD